MKKQWKLYIMVRRDILFKGEIRMIFKVLYQENPEEVAFREHTKALYIEADSVYDVRQKLQERDILIEFIQPLTGKFLEFEQQNEDFKLENV